MGGIGICLVGEGMKAELQSIEISPGIIIIGRLCEESKEEIARLIGLDNLIELEEFNEINSKIFKTKEEITGRLISNLDTEMTTQRLKDIKAFEIKSRKDLEILHNVFERETKSTKSFINKINQEYARKKWRK